MTECRTCENLPEEQLEAALVEGLSKWPLAKSPRYPSLEPRFEDEFFGFRHFSISDLAGPRSTERAATPATTALPPPQEAPNSWMVFSTDLPPSAIGPLTSSDKARTSISLPSCYEIDSWLAGDGGSTASISSLRTTHTGNLPHSADIVRHKSSALSMVPPSMLAHTILTNRPIFEHASIEQAFVPSEQGSISALSTPTLELDPESPINAQDTSLARLDASPGSLRNFHEAGPQIVMRDLQDDFFPPQDTNLEHPRSDVDDLEEDDQSWENKKLFGVTTDKASASDPQQVLPSTNSTVNVCLRNADTTPTYVYSVKFDNIANEDCYISPDTNVQNGSGHRFGDLWTNLTDNQPISQRIISAEYLRLDQAAASNEFKFPGRQYARCSNARPPPSALEPELAPSVTSSVLRPRLTNTIRENIHDQVASATSTRMRNDHHSHVETGRDSSIACKMKGTPPPQTSIWQSPDLQMDVTSPMPRALSGFKGQFDIPIPETSNPSATASLEHTFGDAHHLNGLITNIRFMPDPSSQNTDISRPEVDPDSSLYVTLHHAEKNALRAALLEQHRTSDERVFRREVHRECALARLEGVPVGFYRYYLGFQTVEDYVAARVCVCWDKCWCAKICTRFGDVKCPCSEHLSLKALESSD